MEFRAVTHIELKRIGTERAPLLVVDNFASDPDALVRTASSQVFTEQSRYYPGIRAAAPRAYQELFGRELRERICGAFDLRGHALTFSLCHFSLVTTPRELLLVPQRIPHVDSLATSGLASIHYLFRKNLGGTAFYRHRATGFEYVDESRNERYLAALRAENLHADVLGVGYINGSTPFFEQIEQQDGVFNRLLIYRRNSLHSGCIDEHFVPDPDPATGRLLDQQLHRLYFHPRPAVTRAPSGSRLARVASRHGSSDSSIDRRRRARHCRRGDLGARDARETRSARSDRHHHRHEPHAHGRPSDRWNSGARLG